MSSAEKRNIGHSVFRRLLNYAKINGSDINLLLLRYGVERMGPANSRMKDFFDVWLLSRLFDFEGRTLCEAVSNTFERRSTPLPAGLPFAFTDDFRKDTQKQTQWRAFIRRSKPDVEVGGLDVVIDDILTVMMPLIEGLRDNIFVELFWAQGGPWK